MYTVQNLEEDEIIFEHQNSGRQANPRSVVSLEAFFNDPNCIISSVNKSDSRTVIFYEVLKNIRNREDVEAVWVEISGIRIWEEEGKFLHPITDRVYIITSASKSTVASWVKPLKPDLISEGWLCDLMPENLADGESEGNEVFALYWGYYPELFNGESGY